MHNQPESSRELLEYYLECTMHHPEMEEAKAIAFAACMATTGYTRTDIISDKPLVLRKEKWSWIQKVGARLKNDEPVQYIFNSAWFYGREFYAAPGVLIPRQETEELVELIINENGSSSGRLLDIGTGSGCIAISIALALPKFEVIGVDISDEALVIARQNNEKLKAPTQFQKLDILSSEPEGRFHVIVSNPPYVPGRERKDMLKTVSSFEPGLALFVPNDDSLLFYRRIMQLSEDHLAPDGKIYFEIHESFGDELIFLAVQMGFDNPRLIKDINSKNRFLVL